MVKLFHLHFYCNDVERYEKFLIEKLNLKIKGRFSRDGNLLSSDFSWEDIKQQDISIRLVELQRGGINIVLMPGKFEEPKLEHFGFYLDEETFDSSLSKAKELGLIVRERPNRVFISSKMGFRLEVHKNEDNIHKVTESDFEELYISQVEFSVEEPQHFCELLRNLFNLGSEFPIKTDKGSIFCEKGKFALKGFKIGGSIDYNFDSALIS